MNVEVFALCEAATDSQGKLNILGAFDGIWTKTVPAIHPQCAVAIRLRFNRIEQGDHKIALHFVDDDGKMIIPPLNAGIQVNFGQDQSSGIANLVLNIQGLKLEKYGEYCINLAIDGRQEASIPLFVKPVPNH
jgi:hypothetical protein